VASIAREREVGFVIGFHYLAGIAVGLTTAFGAAGDAGGTPLDREAGVLDTLAALAERPDEEVDVAAAALVVAKGIYPDLDVQAHLRQVDRLARELRTSLAPHRAPEARLRTMAQVVYGDWGYAARDVLPPGVFVGFNEVLERRQWNCLGLTVLYIALGQRVGMPMRMVSGPGHVFVEYIGPPALHVETTDHGRVHARKDYLTGYLPFPHMELDDYVALNAKRTVAVILSQTALAVQNRGRAGLARQYYEMALRFDQGHAEAHAGLGFLHAASGSASEAAAAFRRAIELSPRLPEAYGGLGNLLHATGDLSGALDVYERLLEIRPDEPKTVFNMGQVLYEAGDLDGSIAAFGRYTKLMPGDPDGFARLAFPLEDKGDVAGAMSAYRETLRIDPTYADAHVNLGFLLEREGKTAEAMEAYEAALTVRPKHALAMAGRGRVLAAGGQTGAAIELLEKALALSPGNPVLWLDYGNILRQAGRLEEAVAAYRRAIGLDPTDAETHLALAQALLEAGNPEEARAHAARAQALGAKIEGNLADLVSRGDGRVGAGQGDGGGSTR